MKAKAIYIGSEDVIDRVYSDTVKSRLAEKLDFIPGVFNAEEIKSRVFADVEYAFSSWGMAVLTEEEIKEHLPSLKAVFYAAGTVQYFAKPFLSLGIKVFSAWAANAVPVAEYTAAQIILANKGFFRSAPPASIGSRNEAEKEFAHFGGNFGAKLGIIGAGMIGKLVIEFLRGRDIEIEVFDPFLSDEDAGKLSVKKVSLETLFSECSVVSNHLANNPQTVNMLNGALFEKLPPYATFINTGRGAQVVENELIAVLERRTDLTAILDVTFPEPPEADSGFFRLPNCILTPHIAGSSGNEVKRMSEYMLREFESFISGSQCRYEVTEKMLETMA